MTTEEILMRLKFLSKFSMDIDGSFEDKCFFVSPIVDNEGGEWVSVVDLTELINEIELNLK